MGAAGLGCFAVDRNERETTTAEKEGKGPAPTSTKKNQLLEKYELGEVLGQGAFGIVYLCTKKGTKEEFAVKMIDKVESPLADIQREVEMLQRCAHRTVVALRDVFYEKCFVCMVLDIYKGGDLIEGMQSHWEKKGMIPPGKVKHITRQLMEALAWLHSNSIVHRDVKADNYLTDRKDIIDPECRVFLNDFGTVVEVKPGQRLMRQCGTKLYWAPEFYRLDYGLKVDMWAIGVVMYGVVSGRFPFKNEKDVRCKEVAFKPNINKTCVEFVKALLNRDESQRLSGDEAVAHAWLKPDGVVENPEGDEKEACKPTMKERGAHAGVDERRRELVERLEEAHKRRETCCKGAKRKLPSTDFQVEDKRAGRTVKYEWWSPEQVKEKGIANLELATAPSAHAKDKTDVIERMLQEHGINTSLFGKGTARSLADFASEVQSGDSRLMLDANQHKNLVRVVDLVLLKIVHGSGDQRRYLIHSGERYADGRERDDIRQLPGTKKAPHENVVVTAERLLSDRLNMNDCQVTFDFESIESYEEDQESPHYPGVRTVYRKEIVWGEVATSDSKVLERIGVSGTHTCSVEDAAKNVMTYRWLTEAECKEQKVKMEADSQQHDVSALVFPPVGFDEDNLQKFLETNGVDTEKFGEGNYKTLQEFSDELVKGEAALQRQQDGSFLRVVDIVALVLSKPGGSGEMLVEVEEVFSNGSRSTLNRLPARKHRPDENEFLAAQRILEQVLKVDDKSVKLDPEAVKVLEEVKESHSYPGIKQTVYRKRLIPAAAM